MIEDQPAVEGDGQQEEVVGGENEGNDNEEGSIESYHNMDGMLRNKLLLRVTINHLIMWMEILGKRLLLRLV